MMMPTSGGTVSILSQRDVGPQQRMLLLYHLKIPPVGPRNAAKREAKNHPGTDDAAPEWRAPFDTILQRAV
jgi:hypothetical protein